jgi:hypothetical protein
MASTMDVKEISENRGIRIRPILCGNSRGGFPNIGALGSLLPGRRRVGPGQSTVAQSGDVAKRKFYAVNTLALSAAFSRGLIG